MPPVPVNIEIQNIAPVKYLRDLGGFPPTLSSADDIRVGDFIIDTSIVGHVWQCLNNTPGATVYAKGNDSVDGPSSSLNGHFAAFQGTDGKKLQDSGCTASSFDPAGAASSVQSALNTHISNQSNPHQVNKTQVGLSNVPNIDATNAANITSGILPSERLPAPGHSVKGGVALPPSATGKFYRDDGTWSDAATGTIGGSLGSTDRAIVISSGTGGSTVQGSAAKIDANGSINIPSGQKFKINNNDLSYTDVGAERADPGIQSHIANTSEAHGLVIANVTVQGNVFNGSNQLVKLMYDGKLPPIDGSLLTNLPSSAPITVIDGGSF